VVIRFRWKSSADCASYRSLVGNLSRVGPPALWSYCAMARRVEIHCINKSARQNPHERIRFVGGVNPDKAQWKMSEEGAAAEGSDNAT
jgi:hypothetical protein